MRIYLLILLLSLFTSGLYANTWTVGNRAGANFINPQNAINAASEGDTILITSSSVTYGNLSIDKRLVVFGSGYFLNQNTGLQADSLGSKVGQLTFTAGSNGSLVQGLHITKGVSISGKNNDLSRCYITGQTSGGGSLRVENSQDSCIIKQNYIVGSGSFTTLSGGSNYAFIYNNYISATKFTLLLVGGKINNNIIYCNVNVTSLEYNNNIQGSGSFTKSGVTPYNNIGHSTQYGTTEGNQSNVDMNTVFILTGSTDKQWQLAASSPATGAGFGGVDCGMYDNSAGREYIPSGIPPIPAIYEFTVEPDLSNVTLKIRSNQ